MRRLWHGQAGTFYGIENATNLAHVDIEVRQRSRPPSRPFWSMVVEIRQARASTTMADVDTNVKPAQPWHSAPQAQGGQVNLSFRSHAASRPARGVMPLVMPSSPRSSQSRGRPALAAQHRVTPKAAVQPPPQSQGRRYDARSHATTSPTTCVCGWSVSGIGST